MLSLLRDPDWTECDKDFMTTEDLAAVTEGRAEGTENEPYRMISSCLQRAAGRGPPSSLGPVLTLSLLLLTVQWGRRRRGKERRLDCLTEACLCPGKCQLVHPGRRQTFQSALRWGTHNCDEKPLSLPVLKYLCLAHISADGPHFHNQDAAWLWPVGNIKPHLQVLSGTRSSCLEELTNPPQKLQHRARMPSAEHTAGTGPALPAS